jgi:hypothetical protein
MSPEQRKVISETRLHKRGIRLNLQLPEIETNEEVQLRSADQLLRRLVALWIVAGAASSGDIARFRAYVTYHAIESWLSTQEYAFLWNDAPDETDIHRFTWRREALFFLAWCAGLIKAIDIPSGVSSIAAITALFPQGMEEPDELKNAIRIRTKDTIMDWADLLYRLHWAVRHASLIGKPSPANLDGAVVREWHQAANWMIGYEEEDDWDLVGTDT